jgi:hypothetical protein
MRLLVPQAAGRRPFREEREEPPNARVAESLLLGVHDSADGDFCQTGKPLLQVARHSCKCRGLVFCLHGRISADGAIHRQREAPDRLVRWAQELPLQGAGTRTQISSAGSVSLRFSQVCGSPPGKVRASPATSSRLPSLNTRATLPLRT